MEREYQKLYGLLFGPVVEGTRWAGTKLQKLLMNSASSPAKPKPTVSTAPTKPSIDHLEGLTPEDQKWIAYGVSGEAARGTDDEFGVAASMINRMRSPDFPNTAKEVVFQRDPWQYEAVELGKATHDPALQQRLFSGDGPDGLAKALKILNGRQYFKGQSELSNRSNVGNELGDNGLPIMDPMFHPKGNFYHYGHQ